MSRSTKKPPFLSPSLVEKLQGIELMPETEKKKLHIKTYSRSSTIIPKMIGLTIYVHNGKEFIPVFIKEDMIGHKLGEFAFTRKFTKHSGDKQAQRRIS